MEQERYDIEISENDFVYWFYSNGPKGRILKTVQFQYMPEYGKNFFNLAFGDAERLTDKPDDRAISDNGDYLKVLHTVAKVVQNFINLWPKAIIQIKGSSLSRTRLYQMGIASFWLEVSHEFNILGELNGDWIPFKKGVNYTGFLVFRKIK